MTTEISIPILHTIGALPDAAPSSHCKNQPAGRAVLKGRISSQMTRPPTSLAGWGFLRHFGLVPSRCRNCGPEVCRCHPIQRRTKKAREILDRFAIAKNKEIVQHISTITR